MKQHFTTADIPRTQHLTVPDKEFDRLVKATPPGSMAFWSGTSSVPGAVCADCVFYGYVDVIRNESGAAVCPDKFPTSCALFKKFTGQHGKPLKPKTAACKYYEPKRS